MSLPFFLLPLDRNIQINEALPSKGYTASQNNHICSKHGVHVNLWDSSPILTLTVKFKYRLSKHRWMLGPFRRGDGNGAWLGLSGFLSGLIHRTEASHQGYPWRLVFFTELYLTRGSRIKTTWVHPVSLNFLNTNVAQSHHMLC